MSDGVSAQGSSSGYKMIVYWICTIAALGGLLFGLDQGFIANALPTIDQHYSLDIQAGEAYSAILAWGGILGALLSGLFARFLGRKRSLVFAGFLFSSMSLISAFLPAMPILSACRFLLGFAVGVASFIVPLYLSETAPARIRGSMGTLFQLMITIGIFLISVSNVLLVQLISSAETRLPLMFLVITIFAFLMFLGSIFLPESPRWLMLKGRREKANDVLKKTLNTQEEINQELGEIQEALNNSSNVFGAVFKGTFIKILFVGVFMMVFQQLVGINMMIYYAPTIFGYAAIIGVVGMMTVPTVNMLFTFPAIWLVEKWGRKKLLYVGAVMMCVTMVAAGWVFSTTAKFDNPITASIEEYQKAQDASAREGVVKKIETSLPYKYPAVVALLQSDKFQKDVVGVIASGDNGSDAYKEALAAYERETNEAKYKDMGGLIPSSSKIVLLASVILYIFGFAFSWGPVAWLICSEFFPIEGREVGMTITTMVNWTFAGIVMKYSLSFMKAYGNASIFFVFAGGCVLACFFLFFWVPETKGVTLEHIEKNLKSGVKLKNLGRAD